MRLPILQRACLCQEHVEKHFAEEIGLIAGGRRRRRLRALQEAAVPRIFGKARQAFWLTIFLSQALNIGVPLMSHLQRLNVVP